MKVRSNNSVNKVRQAVLAGIFTLTGSAGAMAAVPASPVIDWIDASVQSNEDGQFIEIDLGWSRYDLEDVASVQYRIDGRPVMSRAVEPGQTFGDIVLPVGTEADFDLTVAFCNADGCTESDLINISISDDHEAEVSFEPRNAPQNDVNSRSAVVQDGGAAVSFDGMYSTRLLAPATTNSILTDLASEAGKAALSGLIRAGADFGFSFLLNHLGLGEQDFGDQLSEMQGSLNALGVQIAGVTNAIEALDNKVTWQGFLNQHSVANEAANEIYSNFEDVTGWLTAGVQPDRESWTAARSAIKTAVTTLAGSKANNGGGTVDVRDGAIYQLMNATPQGVASADSYWPIIDQYRDYYRTAISFGYLALDLIEDEFDGTGTTRVMADNALAVGQIAVLNMYSYGVAPELPMDGVDTLGYAQARGKVVGLTSYKAAALDENTNSHTAGLLLRDMFYDIQDQYDPANHDWQTTEEFFGSLNIPTAYVYSWSGGADGTGWDVKVLDEGTPFGPFAEPPTYEIKPRVAQINGNNWNESYQRLCGPDNAAICGEWQNDEITTWEWAEVIDLIDQRKAAISANGGFMLQNGAFAYTNFGRVVFTDRLNHAGWAADFDADAIQSAAFGDGAATLTAGQLPGPDGTSSCIGLPSENQTLLATGDYALQWRKNGNLVLRNSESGNQWTTATYNWGEKLCFMPKGNLLVMQGSQVFWSSDTGDGALGGYGGRQLKLFQDGTLQIVNELSDVIWQVGPFE